MDAVVGGAAFLAQHGDFRAGKAKLMQFLEKLVANHAVADDYDLHVGITLSLRRRLRDTPATALKPVACMEAPALRGYVGLK
ncbi:hypothetical protein SDC9_209099 [bioreactor metagenome]|uniref:Uncharacterized protein n=1 Tax=bioreactor metagenome TaxID=1076179 RepID=A0A645JP49_9ZZZZ